MMVCISGFLVVYLSQEIIRSEYIYHPLCVPWGNFIKKHLCYVMYVSLGLVQNQYINHPCYVSQRNFVINICVVYVSQGLVQNQSRARTLQDTTVYPDLCMKHRELLTNMSVKFQLLQDLQRRIIAAKDELSANLHTRLR